MSQNEETDKFWVLVDRIIELVNEESDELDLGIVNSALTEAAARFSSFYVASSSESKKDLLEDKPDILKSFAADYKGRLASNIDDYVDHYKEYLGAAAQKESDMGDADSTGAE